MRTFVIGDIHGAFKALEQVLTRSPFDIQEDFLIFLGDYVDGWSESAEVVQHLIELKEVMKDRIIFLRGNHDKWCEDWLLMGQTPLNWVMQGGQSTIDSYIRTGKLTDDSHRQFFKNLINYHIDSENRGFVHGGFVSRKGLGHDTYQANYYWDRDLWQIACLLHNKEAQAENNQKALRFRSHKELYIGHTSTGNWKCKPHYPEYNMPEQKNKGGDITVPMNRCNVWNMDTGAGFEGKLTIMDINTKEFWQSDLSKDLYPDEKGR